MPIDAVALARWEAWLAADPANRQSVEEAAGDPARAGEIAAAAGLDRDVVVSLLERGGPVVRPEQPAADAEFSRGLSPSQKETARAGSRTAQWQQLAEQRDSLDQRLHILRIKAGEVEPDFHYMQLEGMGLLPDLSGHTIDSVRGELARLERQQKLLESSARTRLERNPLFRSGVVEYVPYQPTLLADLLDAWSAHTGQPPTLLDLKQLAELSTNPGRWGDLPAALASIPVGVRADVVRDTWDLPDIGGGLNLDDPTACARATELRDRFGYVPRAGDFPTLKYMKPERFEALVRFLDQANRDPGVHFDAFPITANTSPFAGGDATTPIWVLTRDLGGVLGDAGREAEWLGAIRLAGRHGLPFDANLLPLYQSLRSATAEQADALLQHVATDGGFTSSGAMLDAVLLSMRRVPGAGEAIGAALASAHERLGRPLTPVEAYRLMHELFVDGAFRSVDEIIPADLPSGHDLALKDMHLWRNLDPETRALSRAELVSWISAHLRPGKRRLDAEATYEQSFAAQIDRLSLAELHKIRLALTAFEDESSPAVARVRTILEADRADKTAEHGGIIRLDSGFQFTPIPSRARDDLGWLPPSDVSQVDAVLNYHTHPAYGAAFLSGPSGSSPLAADRGALRNFHQDGLIFTAQPDGTFNVDFLSSRFGGPTVDLGNFG